MSKFSAIPTKVITHSRAMYGMSYVNLLELCVNDLDFSLEEVRSLCNWKVCPNFYIQRTAMALIALTNQAYKPSVNVTSTVAILEDYCNSLGLGDQVSEFKKVTYIPLFISCYLGNQDPKVYASYPWVDQMLNKQPLLDFFQLVAVGEDLTPILNLNLDFEETMKYLGALYKEIQENKALSYVIEAVYT